MALLVFYTLPTLVAKAEAPGRTRSLKLGAWLGKRLTRQRPPAYNVYSRAKGVVWGPLGRASPLVSALVTFSHALISPSPDADLNADLLASERACSVS
jgi:hypothetical protein